MLLDPVIAMSATEGETLLKFPLTIIKPLLSPSITSRYRWSHPDDGVQVLALYDVFVDVL